MIRTILFLLFAIAFLILGLPVLGAEWLLRKVWKRGADLSTLRIVQWGLRTLEHISGPEVIVRGMEHIPTDQAVLYIGNHRSYFDIVLSYSRCPGLTGYISKDLLEKVPILRAWMRRVYCLFLNREDPRQGLKTILTAIEYVKSGVSIFIFPEGTRAKTDEMLPFKEGSFKVATKTGCPIIPVAFTNTSAIFEDHVPFIRKARVVITYDEPILPSELAPEQKKHIGAYVQGIIADMLKENEKYL